LETNASGASLEPWSTLRIGQTASLEGGHMGDLRDRDLKVGLILPTWTGSLDGRTPRWTDILGLARLAEDVGFDSLWLPDMLRYRFGEGIDPLACWETWSLVAGLAASTRRLEIGTLVLVGAYRSPALLAEMAETVDEISGGRLVLGIGAGVNQDEHDAYGFSWEHRFDRLEEALTVIRGLFRDGHVDFALRDALARLLGRPVDLVMARALTNRYLEAAIDAERQPVYAA
jgi:alkanesulfonate monooxygenase SsuD/methylene tetrahydromethanopterin reductase-like flavin-dependent oxidoreductase (luciferase family)